MSTFDLKCEAVEQDNGSWTLKLTISGLTVEWTGGGKTDIRSRWAACSKWEKPDG